MKNSYKLRTRVQGAVPTVVQACAVLMMGVVGQAQADWTVTNDFSVAENSVSGSGQASSNLSDGSSFNNVLGIQGRGSVGEYLYNFNLGLKATDDTRNDPEKLTLTNLQGQLAGGNHTVTAGDTYEAFSQYTLSSAIKGLSYRYGSPDGAGTQLTVLGGYAYPRWQTLWDRDISEQKISGIHLRQEVLPELSIGASVVHQEDDKRFDTESLIQNTVSGVDWEYLPIEGLTIKGESAFNDTSESPFTGPKLSYSGHAHKVEAIGDGGPSRVRLEYENVSPEFVSTTGAATADREKFKADWRYRPVKDTTWRFGFLAYRDNLDDQLAATTNHYRPELQWIKRNFIGRQQAQLDLSYKYDNARRERSATQAAETRNDHLLSALYRDRFALIDIDAELASNIYDTSGAARDEQEVFGNISLSSRKDMGMFILKPSMRAGMWQQQDELADTRDKRTEYSVGLGVDVPEYRVTSSLRVGRNELNRDDAKPAVGAIVVTDSSRTFASMNINYHPESIAFLRDGMVYLRASMNDFSYSLVGRDYKEKSIVAGIKIKL